MSVVVGNVFNKVGIIANDPQHKRWTTDELLVWLEEGARHLAVVRDDANVKRATATLSRGAKQTLPSDAIKLLEIRTSLGAVRPCDRHTLDAFAPGWETKNSAVKVQNFMFDTTEHPVFWVYPPQASDATSVELVYTAYPATPTLNGTLSIQGKYEPNLVNYLLFRIFSKDSAIGSADRAAACLQLFNS